MNALSSRLRLPRSIRYTPPHPKLDRPNARGPPEMAGLVNPPEMAPAWQAKTGHGGDQLREYGW